MAGDAIARFQRLRGREVLLIVGTDEHGQKIQRAAEQRGLSPQAHCDEIAAGFKSLWQKLNISFDRFIRTTDPRHQCIVEAFFERVWQAEDIYEGRQQGWYCVSCEEYKEERDLLEGRRCAIHTNLAAEWRDEPNYFFRLSRYQEKLEAFYQANPDFIQPEIRRNEVLSFVSQGLRDFSISRSQVSWGLPLPVNPDQTIYVWVDALLGYMTALLDADQPPTLDNALGQWWPINLHLVGKDILRFHAVYWPAMLLSAGLPLPKQVFGHGFLTKDGQKMGKSLGNVVDPYDLVARYGSDAVRYYFLKEIEFGRDGDFSEERFVNILNADLANDLGNLLNRTSNIARKSCDGRVPLVDPAAIAVDQPLRRLGESLGERAAAAYEALAFSRVCEAILEVVRQGNRLIDEQKPWSLYKDGKTAAADLVIYAVLESVRLAAFLLSPIIPQTSGEIYRQLGYPEAVPMDWGQAKWGALPGGQAVLPPSPVFTRLEMRDS